MSAGYDPAVVEDALRLMHEPGTVFEVRIPNAHKAGTVSGYFNGHAAAAAAIAKWDGKAPGIYVTINPVDPSLLARASNRLQEWAKATSGDKDVVCRRWILIDVDFHRPTGISATDEELKAAGQCARQIKAHLEDDRGWPAGILAMSGNGAHLLYRIDLPREDESLVHNCLSALAAAFDVENGAHVDLTMANASRIAKVAGTMAAKGDNLPERPHRRAKLIEVPAACAVVPTALLESLAGSAKVDKRRAERATASGGKLDVVAFMQRHGIEVLKHKPDADGDKWDVVCPFNADHNTGSAMIRQYNSGALAAKCQHHTCTWGWSDLRERFEPRGASDGARVHVPLSRAATLPHPPDAGTDEASEVWHEPVPQPRIAAAPDILAAFAAEIQACGVVGEDRLAKVTFLAITSRILERPVSVVVKGPSAAGKSFVTEQVLRYFPASAYKSLSGMSEHALVYLDEPLSHRFLVVYEAAGLTGDLASYLVRSLLSEGRVEYVTVVKGKGGLVPKKLVIEGPTGVLTTTTAISLHPENETRLLSVPASDTAHQTKSVFYALASEVQAIERPVEEWHQLQRWIEDGGAHVTIPFARRLAELVPPVAVRLRRDFSTVLNMTRAHALLHRANRETDNDGRVIATVADYGAVRGLIADLVADEVGATVSASTQEAVRAVTRRHAQTEKPVTLPELAAALDLDKSAAARRARQAIAGGYLKNLEDKRGKPARYVSGEPLPAEQVVLPLPESLECGTVAVCSEGVVKDAAPTSASVDRQCGTVAACLEGVVKDAPDDDHDTADSPSSENGESTATTYTSAQVDMLREAAHMAVDTDVASRSLLQRRLNLYETEAEQLLDLLETVGVISGNGARARSVLVDHDEADRLIDRLAAR